MERIGVWYRKIVARVPQTRVLKLQISYLDLVIIRWVDVHHCFLKNRKLHVLVYIWCGILFLIVFMLQQHLFKVTIPRIWDKVFCVEIYLVFLLSKFIWYSDRDGISEVTQWNRTFNLSCNPILHWILICMTSLRIRHIIIATLIGCYCNTLSTYYFKTSDVLSLPNQPIFNP